jgi:uncharacterized protein YpmB
MKFTRHQVIGLIIVAIGLVMLVGSFLIHYKQDSKNSQETQNQEDQHLNKVEDLQKIEPTSEQKEQGVKQIFNDSGVLLLDQQQ